MSNTAKRLGRGQHQFMAHDKIADANAYVGPLNSFSIVMDSTGKPTQIRLHDGVTGGGLSVPIVGGAAAAMGYPAVVASPPVLLTVTANTPVTIEHQLGRLPIVQVPDAQTPPTINHIDVDNVELTFADDGDVTVIIL